MSKLLGDAWLRLPQRVGWKMVARLCYLHDSEVRRTSLERRLWFGSDQRL